MTLYLIVTADKYELPLAVGTSYSDLARRYWGNDSWAGTISKKIRGLLPNKLEDCDSVFSHVSYFIRETEVEDDPESEG